MPDQNGELDGLALLGGQLLQRFSNACSAELSDNLGPGVREAWLVARIVERELVPRATALAAHTTGGWYAAGKSESEARR